MKAKALLMILAVLVFLPLPVAAEEEFRYTYFETAYIDNGMDDNLTAIDGQERIDLNIGEGDGMALRASLALSDNIHVFAGYAGSNMDLSATYSMPYPSLDEMRAAFFGTPGSDNWDGLCDLNEDGMVNAVDLGLMKAAGSDLRVVDSAAVDGDMTDWRFGVGYNRLLTPRISGYAQLFWTDRDLDFDRTEFMGEEGDIDVSDNGFGATLGARAKVFERMELTGHVTYTPVGDVNLLADNQSDRLRNDTLGGISAEYWLTDALSISAGVEGDGDVKAWTLGARYDIGASR